jgi:hypothetical protein
VKHRTVDELRREMERLMKEHLESLKAQAFLPPSVEEREQDESRLKLIREISADYLAAIQGSQIQIGGKSMTDKPSVTLPGKVEKVIEPRNGEPEKAQIAIEGADPLYSELRIENAFQDASGDEVRLKENDSVDVTVEADPESANLEDDKEQDTVSLEKQKRKTA